jgi:hypothetical protein
MVKHYDLFEILTKNILKITHSITHFSIPYSIYRDGNYINLSKQEFKRRLGKI